jgi:hypothetical protein
MSDLCERILNFIRERDYVSFPELIRNVEGVGGGDVALHPPGYENIIFWTGLSEEGAAAITELIAKKAIVPSPSSVLVYGIDGGMLRLPLARQKRRYKTLHWAPITLRPGTARTPERLAAGC